MGAIAVLLLIVLIGLILFLLAIIGIYNALVQLRNQADNAWSQIDVQLKRRHDLIPNLVETAKGYMKHERETFEKITEARSQAMGAKNVADAAKAENALTGALSKFMLVVENYPDLKANQNFLALQETLTSTENKIAFARQAYNDQVLDFNDQAAQFPAIVVARLLGFPTAPMLEATRSDEERAAPRVQF